VQKYAEDDKTNSYKYCGGSFLLVEKIL
jgi:hypothetical protein